jgi:hypothetical protein
VIIIYFIFCAFQFEWNSSVDNLNSSSTTKRKNQQEGETQVGKKKQTSDELQQVNVFITHRCTYRNDIQM